MTNESSAARPATFAVKQVIINAARRAGVPEQLALVVAKIESNFNPQAVNPSGAKGLFQVMYGAVTDVVNSGHVKFVTNWLDPDWNAAVGTKYLAICAKYIGLDVHDPSDWPMIYAAYNIGAGNVLKLMRNRVDKSVEAAIASQAERLRQGGARAYLANIRNEFAELRATV